MSICSAWTIAGTVMGSTSIASTAIAGNVSGADGGVGDGGVVGTGSLAFATSTAVAGRVVTGVAVLRGRKRATVSTQAAAAGTIHIGRAQTARRGAPTSRMRVPTRA